MPMTEVAVQSIELEQFVETIPDFEARFNKLDKRLVEDGNKVNISNMTLGGSTARAPMRVPFRVQGGAGISQFAADTATTVPIWQRGTGSQYRDFVAAPVRLVNTCEISNLANEATNGKERGLVKVNKEEMKQTLKSYLNGREGIINQDGSGTIDQIPTTATIANGTGPAGPQFSSIVGLNVAASFTDQQTVQVLSAVGGTNRGSFVISYVDPVAQAIYSTTALPAGTAVSDILVVQGSTGAAGASVYGKNYWIANGNVGTIAGIDKSLYPGRLSTPTINLQNQGAVTNALAQRVEAIRSRAMGDDYDENDKAFWYMNPAQGIGLAQNFYNPGYTRLDQGGDTVTDTAKKMMQKTWAGREVVYSNTQQPNRIDLFVPKYWYVGVLFETRLHEWTPGNTIAPVPAIGGASIDTYYDSIMFGYESGIQLVCNNPKAQFYFQNVPVATV